MITSPSPYALPELSSMDRICRERILLCGPCDTLMSDQEYRDRRKRLDELADAWTLAERTDFWYTMDALCADGNPLVRATPGLTMTPENFAFEDVRLNRVSAGLVDPTSEIEGFPVWGFKLYADPVFYSFSQAELVRFAVARLACIEGATPSDLEKVTASYADAL